MIRHTRTVSRKMTFKHAKLQKMLWGKEVEVLFLATGYSRTNPVSGKNRSCLKTVLSYLRGQVESRRLSPDLILSCLSGYTLRLGRGTGSLERGNWGRAQVEHQRAPSLPPDSGPTSLLPEVLGGDPDTWSLGPLPGPRSHAGNTE